MILIKIDRKSIRKNPNAGRATQKVAGRREVTFTCTGELPEYLKNEKYAIITQESETWSTDEIIKEYSGLIIDESILDKLYKTKDAFITIEMNQEWDTLTFPPEQTYFYDYKNTKVKCAECGHKFMSNEFAEFENEWDDYYSHTHEGCPECGEWDCCDVRYEIIAELETADLPN